MVTRRWARPWECRSLPPTSRHRPGLPQAATMPPRRTTSALRGPRSCGAAGPRRVGAQRSQRHQSDQRQTRCLQTHPYKTPDAKCCFSMSFLSRELKYCGRVRDRRRIRIKQLLEYVSPVAPTLDGGCCLAPLLFHPPGDRLNPADSGCRLTRARLLWQARSHGLPRAFDTGFQVEVEV